jgi:hypothetical protein
MLPKELMRAEDFEERPCCLFRLTLEHLMATILAINLGKFKEQNQIHKTIIITDASGECDWYLYHKTIHGTSSCLSLQRR